MIQCSLLYGAEDPSVAGMVLDSAFSNLYDLMMELVDVYKIRLPKFTVQPLLYSTFYHLGSQVHTFSLDAANFSINYLDSYVHASVV